MSSGSSGVSSSSSSSSSDGDGSRCCGGGGSRAGSVCIAKAKKHTLMCHFEQITHLTVVPGHPARPVHDRPHPAHAPQQLQRQTVWPAVCPEEQTALHRRQRCC